MENIKILTLPLLVSSVSFAQQVPVYPANAGALTTVQSVSQVNQGEQGTAATQSKNIFLEYYAKQGSNFSAPVFFFENNALVKRDISYDDLKKSVVIFFGDWCPHCHKFLTEFSKHIATLAKSAINVVFLHIPSVEKLKNWQEPSVQDYQSVVQKLSSYGINSSASNVKIVLLGERTVLSQLGISGLPIFLAVKNAKEYFRGVGDSGVSKLQLSDPDTLKQFLEIWGKDESSKADHNEKKEVKKSKKLKKKTQKKVVRTAKSKQVKLSKKALLESKTATEMLNSAPWKPLKMDLNSN